MNRIGIIGAMQIEIDLLLEKLLIKEEHTIAGGLHPDVKIGDLVISTNVTHHDVNKNQMKNLFPFQEVFHASKELRDLARKAVNSSSLNITVHEGRIVSGECFVEDSKLKEQLVTEYVPHCTEMEGAAIGHVSYINDIPFLVLRCISDSADDSAQVSYDDFAKTAANYCSEIIVEMLKNISIKAVL